MQILSEIVIMNIGGGHSKKQLLYNVLLMYSGKVPSGVCVERGALVLQPVTLWRDLSLCRCSAHLCLSAEESIQDGDPANDHMDCDLFHETTQGTPCNINIGWGGDWMDVMFSAAYALRRSGSCSQSTHSSVWVQPLPSSSFQCVAVILTHIHCLSLSPSLPGVSAFTHLSTAVSPNPSLVLSASGHLVTTIHLHHTQPSLSLQRSCSVQRWETVFF